jgi:hypothetical protein
MPQRLLAVVGIPFSALLLLLPQGAAASHQDRTACTRQFLTLPEPLTDPFGYRYTKPLTIPGIGRRRRIAECDYIPGGGLDDRSRDTGEMDRGRRGEAPGGGEGGPRIDYARYIADLLREKEAKRKRPEVPRDRPTQTPPPAPPLTGAEPRDSDCDGFTDAEEYFLKSDPHDPLDPHVEEPYRRRTVSLDPQDPCYGAIGKVVMPKTGWERPAPLTVGAWLIPPLLLVWFWRRRYAHGAHAAITTGNAGASLGPRGQGRLFPVPDGLP